MKKKSITTAILITALLILLQLFSGISTEQKIRQEFEISWSSVTDGCGMTSYLGSVNLLVGTVAIIQYDCGMKLKPEPKTQLVFIPVLGQILGIPKPVTY